MDLNMVSITGRLTKNVEMRKSPSGRNVVSGTIACNRMKENEVDFIEFNAWNQSAKYLYDYAQKGTLIGLQGELRIDNWQDGSIYRSRTYVLATKVTILNGVKQPSSGIQQTAVTPPTEKESIAITNDDLPF